MSKVVTRLQQGGAPILLARGKKPVAALISLQDFAERFAAKAAVVERDQVLAAMDALARTAVDTATPEALVHNLRESL